MADAKDIVAIVISLIILAFAVENIPTLKSSAGSLFTLFSITLPEISPHTSTFPISMDAGVASQPISINADSIQILEVNSKNVSLVFDDRQIIVNPSVLEDIVISSYSGKISSFTINGSLRLDGNAKGIASNLVTITSQRSVTVTGNISFGTVKLSGVSGGTISVSNAVGSAVYNKTNTVSLLGDNVKIDKFNGDISIGSYGVILDGTASYFEIKSAGKTVQIG
ncbi:MAG: hypothetical protein V1836_02855 [Candidatus Aenigmatarchaeota archaeon]